MCDGQPTLLQEYKRKNGEEIWRYIDTERYIETYTHLQILDLKKKQFDTLIQFKRALNEETEKGDIDRNSKRGRFKNKKDRYNFNAKRDKEKEDN